jgi:hypothetical protein
LNISHNDIGVLSVAGIDTLLNLHTGNRPRAFVRAAVDAGLATHDPAHATSALSVVFSVRGRSYRVDVTWPCGSDLQHAKAAVQRVVLDQLPPDITVIEL